MTALHGETGDVRMGSRKPESRSREKKATRYLRALPLALCTLQALCLLSACQTSPFSGPSQSAGGALSPHLKKETVSPKFLFQVLEARQASLKDLKSFIRTAITKKNSTHTFKQALLIKGSDSIRIETLGMFGRSLGVFIHDKDKTILYDPGGNRLFRGKEVWDVMARVVGTVMDFDEYISLLSGNIPHLQDLKVISARLGREKKYYRLDVLDAARHHRFIIEMDAFTLVPARLVKTADGRQVYVVQWEDYREMGGYPFAHRVIISRPLRGEKLEIKFNKPRINSGITKEPFQFTPPAPLSPVSSLASPGQPRS